ALWADADWSAGRAADCRSGARRPESVAGRPCIRTCQSVAPDGADCDQERPTMSQRLINLQNVKKVYKTRDKEVLAVSDVTMEVNDGDFVSLVGPSGCGKTTVLKILAGLHNADGGTVEIGGANIPFVPG